MFPGIIEEVGAVAEAQGGVIRIRVLKIGEDAHLGDSIAINGVDLTVTENTRSSWPTVLRRRMAMRPAKSRRRERACMPTLGWRHRHRDGYRSTWRDKTMKYKIALRESEEGFSVSVPGLPGCWSQGATEQEALQNIQDAIKEYLATVEDLLEGATVREVEVSA